MRRVATIQEIADVTPIDGADSIELVHIKGWQCVAKKGEFNKGIVKLFIIIFCFSLITR